MNKKMKIFIICAVFALMISCKNYASGEDIKQNVKEKVEGFLDKELMQGDDPNNSLFNPPPTLPASSHDNMPVLKVAQAQDGSQQEKKEDKGKEEIEKQIKELKDKMEKSDKKNTSLKIYSEYEKEMKKVREELEEKLKDKEEDKEKLEKELKKLEDSLKKKKEDRKKALEDANKKFEEFKGKVSDARGETHGEQARGQGSIGQQAFKCAQELGFKNMTSGGGDTGNMANEVITNSLKKIEEELKEAGEDKKE
ncbi:conserved hypothetical protein (plasmid) [Borreliella burgdorferi 29805]|uniref:hypothetical protein n=1 Tax=Borreliella burgdorferi TaxID=139 RepID=UPI00017F4858|nr:hypothetical protein [Borreliella burgdorferi]ACO38570.1 conserved hypothetical protein [Borreliella burgdorferi 29805]MCR8905426.1 hypothetical protein [Borreliella burgdorferi]MCR8906871.1 hypothetical protein [Borreliella burgdorferi]PRR45785.1 hypothetical protein CV662_06360 [Borreliella burgdorferi]